MKIAKNVNKLGTELVYDIFAKTKKLQAEGKTIFDLSLGQSVENPPEHVIEATIKALKDGNNGYTVPNGIIECREAVSRKIKSLYNANISPERIFIMPGGKPTMHYAISFYGEPGAEIIYPDPGFPIYESMISYTGAKAVPYNLNDENNFNINVDKILSLINDKTRLLIINNPHNPTGSFAEKKVVDKLANGLKNFSNVAILSDEIYGRLLFEKKQFPTFLNYPELYDRLIVLDGWSKTYAMTGWRLGWGVWPEKLLKHLFKFCVNNHSCVNAAIQHGAIAALDGPDESIDNMVEKFIFRKNLMFNGLKKINGIKCTEPKAGFFMFPNVKETGMNGDEFAEKCLNEAGVALIQGTAFGNSAIYNVRMNFTVSEENISNALEKIKKILN
mgnify:CR=1 FL=1|tara:strand:- start:401 stop:1564 length:1164 start_codon:yes stop_codon:yes gene_type:complete